MSIEGDKDERLGASALVDVIVSILLLRLKDVDKIVGGLGKEMLLDVEAAAATGVVVVVRDTGTLTVAEPEAATAWLVPFELNKSVLFGMVAVTMLAAVAWLELVVSAAAFELVVALLELK